MQLNENNIGAYVIFSPRKLNISNMILILDYEEVSIDYWRCEMEKTICDERHKRIDEKLELHERRLNSHSERLDRIELANGRLEERLNSLITQLENLNKTMKWFIATLVGAFISFFFYAVQQGLFK